MTPRFRLPLFIRAVACIVLAGCGRGGELDAQAVGTAGTDGGGAASGAGATSGRGGAAGTAGAAGAGGHAGGAGGEAGAGGAGATAGTGGASGAAGSSGDAGASGAAGAPSKLAFAAPDVVEFGRPTDCVVPVAWSKDGRADLVTVHASFDSSPEYKSYYNRWRIEKGKLTVVAGPVSLEQLPSAGYPTGGCQTMDLDHDGVLEINTSAAHHWIRSDGTLGTADIGGPAYDLDGDGVLDSPQFSTDANTLTGRAIESKDGVNWTLGATAYSLAMPFAYGGPFAGDFDGDGNKDALLHDVSKTNQVQVVRAATGGPQLLPIATVLDDSLNTIVADMNGDGRADLIAQGKKGYQVAFSDGKGGFTAQVLFPLDAVEGLAAGDSFSVGDVSGDGQPDLILDSPAGVYILESDGVGTWRPVRLVIDWKHWADGGGLGLHLFRVVDMDGDGKNDLVAVRSRSLVAFRNITPSP